MLKYTWNKMPEVNSNILLNGSWKCIPDSAGDISFEQAQELLRSGKAAEMKIPSNWELEGLHNFNGSVWFCKEFSFKNMSTSTGILKFNGVDYFTDAWLNGAYLGGHEGYFQSFFFDITGHLKETNQLIVKVTSPFEEPGTVWPFRKKLIKGIFNHHDCRPGGWDYKRGQDKNTGGIWNDVIIKYGYPVYIKNTKVTSKIDFENNKAILLLDLFYYYNGTTPLSTKVTVKLTSPSGKTAKHDKQVLFRRNSDIVSFTIQADDPVLWWSWDLGKPALYSIIISSEEFEEVSFNYGIREVKIDENQQFFLNGKRLFLRGTNIIPEQFLSSLDEKRIAGMVSLVKDANINIVRVHAHVNRQELYKEFDKAGILVWQDFALQWTYDESPEFLTNAVTQIKEMIKELYNYSSISFWCCHNEPGKQIHTLDHFLKQAVLSEDQTRIIRTASNYEEHPYDGWYWGSKEHYAAVPMGPLVTEFGAQALPALETLNKIFSKDELFPPAIDKWQYHNFQPDQTFNIAKVETGSSIESFIQNSQGYQADLLKTAIELYRRKRFNGITGIFQFMFIDCWPSITWSIVDYFGNPKPGYEIVKKCFRPVFISINVRQNQYYKGKRLLFDLFIINDLYTDFTDCNIVYLFDGKEAESTGNFSLNRDSLYFINYEKININLPGDVHSGNHNVTVKLMQASGPVSENSFSLNVI
jgi:beta-mannosidase